MSVEHEPANPRLDSLLRQIVATGDLQPEQNQRVRARLGLAPDQPTAQPTLTLPASQPAPIRTQEHEAPPMIATTQRLRRQWLQFALAAVAFIAAGVVLAMIFGSGSDDPETRPGVGASPEATATVAPATATTASRDPAVLPTPDGSGTYRGITVEQARQIVPFEIVVPELFPDEFDAPELSVVERRIPSAPGVRDVTVEMVYALTGDGSPAQSVKFTQLGPNSGDVQITNTESTMGITANGVEATRIEGRSTGGDPILAYTWEHDGLHYLILSSPAGELTPELVDALMQDIFAIYTPTVETESARLEQERAELMTVPVPDSCMESSWAGPDFRIRRSASAAYFIEGEGLTLGTTHGVLFAGENQVTWLANAPLTNEEALSGPRTMTIFRSDVVGDPIPVEIPIEDAQQIDHGILPDDVERGWTSSVNLPDEGCWEFQVSLGAHSLMARVYVYPPPAQSDTTYDEALVEQIALADPRVQALLAGHPHQVSQVGMWTGDRGRLIGGFAAISVGGPRKIAGEWFEYSMFDCETQPPPDPVVVSYRAEFAGVTEIHVLVDLSTEAVVLIYPFWEDVSLVGDREFTGEYDEIRQCDTGD